MVKCNQRLNIWIKSVFLRAENILVGKSYISAQVILPTPIFPQERLYPMYNQT